jgi:hypothetical protein
MRMEIQDVSGHAGLVGRRDVDGSLADEDRPGKAVGYRALCSCGWQGEHDYPPDEDGRMSANAEWAVRHLTPLWSVAPPAWMLNRSDGLRDALGDLATSWPLQALGVLAEVERWQRPLTERAVASAREKGQSWAEIGAALGITRQSAHERFRGLDGRPLTS